MSSTSSQGAPLPGHRVGWMRKGTQRSVFFSSASFLAFQLQDGDDHPEHPRSSDRSQCLLTLRCIHPLLVPFTIPPLPLPITNPKFPRPVLGIRDPTLDRIPQHPRRRMRDRACSSQEAWSVTLNPECFSPFNPHEYLQALSSASHPPCSSSPTPPSSPKSTPETPTKANTM